VILMAPGIWTAPVILMAPDGLEGAGDFDGAGRSGRRRGF
jgi:hypothetical protein